MTWTNTFNLLLPVECKRLHILRNDKHFKPSQR